MGGSIALRVTTYLLYQQIRTYARSCCGSAPSASPNQSSSHFVVPLQLQPAQIRRIYIGLLTPSSCSKLASELFSLRVAQKQPLPSMSTARKRAAEQELDITSGLDTVRDMEEFAALGQFLFMFGTTALGLPDFTLEVDLKHNHKLFGRRIRG